MRTDRGAEPSSSGVRAPRRPTASTASSRRPGPGGGSARSRGARPPATKVYARRRAVAAALLVGALFFGLTGCRAVLNWAGGADAQADEGMGVPAPAAPDEKVCPSDAELYGTATEQVPAGLQADIDELLANDAITSRSVSISIWVDGWGEIVAHDPDLALKPASNQKILTAIGALELLPSDGRLTTRLLSTAPVEGGVIDGDLVIVGSGDPSLWDVGPHSIYEIAVELHELGVERVTGSLYVDESRYDTRRIAQGWTDRQIPGDATPISAFTVRANQLGDSYDYLADPATGNLGFFLQYLGDVGVTVEGGLGDGDVPDAGTELVTMPSNTIAELIDNMLRNSDNTTAELLLKEIDVATGGPGSTLGGLAAARSVVEGWCVDVNGTDDDGSGLSYVNARSAREWREIVQVAQQQEWWPTMYEGLPIAGDPDGTLAGRLTVPSTEGNLRAKTGTISVGRALTGVFTTAGGRHATFSAIVNDDVDPQPALGPVDQLLETIAASTD